MHRGFRLRRCCHVNLFMNDETFRPLICYLRSRHHWSSGMPPCWALYTHLLSLIVKQESSWPERWVQTLRDCSDRIIYDIKHNLLHTLIFKERFFLVFKKRKPVHFLLNIPPPGPHCFMSEEMNSPVQLQSPAGRKPRKLHRLSIVLVMFLWDLSVFSWKKMWWEDPVLELTKCFFKKHLNYF